MRFSRLWERVRRRFGTGVAEVAAEGRIFDTQSHLPAMPRARRTGYLHVEAFAGELVRIKDSAADTSPHLHVFSLSDFRNAVGSKWDRLGGLVEVAVESIIRRHVDGENDIFTRLDAEIACLALPNTSHADTGTLVAAIARDISGHLFGDAKIDGRRPQVLAANLPLHDALTESGQMDRAAIDHALAKAGAAMIKGLTAGVAALAPAAGKRIAFAISGGRPERDDPFEIVAQSAAVSESGLTSESSLRLAWTPTWVTSRSAVGAFHARVIRVDKGGARPLEGVRAYRNLAPIEGLTLDRFTATQSARELKSLFYGRQKIGLTVPVHWMSLSPKWGDCIRIPFEDCPIEARRKFLKIEVFGLTPSIPGQALRRMFEPLEKVGCDVMARLPLSAIEMIPALSHVKAVGVDLAELDDDEQGGDEQGGDEALFTRLAAFRNAAKQARIACYVWGVRGRPLIAKVVAAGFSLVNGPAVMCDLARPALPSGIARP